MNRVTAMRGSFSKANNATFMTLAKHQFHQLSYSNGCETGDKNLQIVEGGMQRAGATA